MKIRPRLKAGNGSVVNQCSGLIELHVKELDSWFAVIFLEIDVSSLGNQTAFDRKIFYSLRRLKGKAKQIACLLSVIFLIRNSIEIATQKVAMNREEF